MKHDFFQVLSVQDVVKHLMDVSPLPPETLSLASHHATEPPATCAAHHANSPHATLEGRILAQDVMAKDDVPLTSRSGMDGYAVHAEDTFGTSETNPTYLDCIGRAEIDQLPDFSLQPGQCSGIVTGGVLPAGANAIVMVEYTHDMGSKCIEIRRAVPPGEYVMQQGEDAKQGQCALPAGTLLRPQEVGLLAAMGAFEVAVHRKPRVAILSTGDELLPVTAKPRPGQVRDVNSHTLACLVRRSGGIPWCMGIAPDHLETLEASLRTGLEWADVVLLSGGSSVGTRDLTVAALKRFPEADVFCHGVAISPGKPLILARMGQKMIWGLPGQVTSAQVVMMVLGQPFLRRLSGHAQPFDQSLWPRCRAELSRNVASRQGREDYIRVRLQARPGNFPLATPVLGMSGLLRTMLETHGIIRLPERLEGMEQGQSVDVLLFDGAASY